MNKNRAFGCFFCRLVFLFAFKFTLAHYATPREEGEIFMKVSDSGVRGPQQSNQFSFVVTEIQHS